MSSNMKNVPYGKQFLDEDDIREVIKALKSDWITQGPKVEEFENALCGYTGAKYAVVVSSGTAALHIACLAAGIKKGDEVITSPLTFVASANCILYCGGKPVFVDVEPEIANINPAKIEQYLRTQDSGLGTRPKAIIPIHYAGHPCNLEEIKKIAKKKYNLIVIEDACHALGAEYKNSKIGSCEYSDMTVFSFHPVKSITTGEGGAITTNRKDLYEKFLMYRNHGITKQNLKFKNKNSKLVGKWYYEMQYLGFNYRITDFQCALGVSQLKKLDKFIQRRKEIANIYNDVFKDNEFFDSPVREDNNKSSCHLYPIRLKDKYKEKKALIFNKLREKGLGVQVHYIPVYWQPYYQQLGYKKGICHNAEDFYNKEISIPLYSSMRNDEIDYVESNVFEVFQEVGKL